MQWQSDDRRVAVVLNGAPALEDGQNGRLRQAGPAAQQLFGVGLVPGTVFQLGRVHNAGRVQEAVAGQAVYLLR
jgi:hypothetical protein